MRNVRVLQESLKGFIVSEVHSDSE